MCTCASLLSAHAHKYVGRGRRPHMNSTGIEELTPCNSIIIYSTQILDLYNIASRVDVAVMSHLNSNRSHIGN